MLKYHRMALKKLQKRQVLFCFYSLWKHIGLLQEKLCNPDKKQSYDGFIIRDGVENSLQENYIFGLLISMCIVVILFLLPFLDMGYPITQSASVVVECLPLLYYKLPLSTLYIHDYDWFLSQQLSEICTFPHILEIILKFCPSLPCTSFSSAHFIAVYQTTRIWYMCCCFLKSKRLNITAYNIQAGVVMKDWSIWDVFHCRLLEWWKIMKQCWMSAVGVNMYWTPKPATRRPLIGEVLTDADVAFRSGCTIDSEFK